MSIGVQEYLQDTGGSKFTEDLPTSARPPVPGEETESNHGSQHSGSSNTKSEYSTKSDYSKSDYSHSSAGTPRRTNCDLGFEPEGSASPTPPYLRWAENLQALLSDKDGSQLFKLYLENEDSKHLLEFYFAVNGFKKMDPKDDKTQRLANIVYTKYIKEGRGTLTHRVKPGTKQYLAKNIDCKPLDISIFDQAQLEIEKFMEENAYRMFLESDIYLQYCRNGGEVSPNQVVTELANTSGNVGNLTTGVILAPLPTLHENVELSTEDTMETRTTLPLTAEHLFATSQIRLRSESRDRERLTRGGNPYHQTYAPAPATSANDSEIQSLSSEQTDDTMSLTDSSIDLDGVPNLNHRHRRRRQLKGMRQDAQRNGNVMCYPPFPQPRTQRLPKEMKMMEPKKFAELLIAKLERVKQDRENEERLDEQLRRMEGDSGASQVSDSQGASGSDPAQPRLFPLMDDTTSIDDDPESILDEHVSRVLQTPGCRSPGRHSPVRPKGHISGVPHHMSYPGALAGAAGSSWHNRSRPKDGSKRDSGIGDSSVTEAETVTHYHKYYYHHHHHHPKSREGLEKQTEMETQRKVQRDSEMYTTQSRVHQDSMGGTAESLRREGRRDVLGKRGGGRKEEGEPFLALPVETDRFGKVWDWMEEGERERYRGGMNIREPKSKRSSKTASQAAHRSSGKASSSSAKKPLAYNTSRPTSMERPAVTAEVRPMQPFMQDTQMPVLPQPNPLICLEEARRRLVEKANPKASRHVVDSGARKDKGKLPQSKVVPAVSDMEPEEEPKERKQPIKKPASTMSVSGDNTVVGYYFCGEPIPYRTTLPGKDITLAIFKNSITKRGNYRYFFKCTSTEFGSNAVYQEVTEDEDLLPLWEGKIVGKVERIE
ncbi:axin-1-like isoform X2 [Branchiostoma floridae x Branchiostoma japonicum]